MRRLVACVALLAACEWPSGSLGPSAAPIGYPLPATPGTMSPLSWIVLARDGAPVATQVRLVLDSAARSMGMRLASTPSGPPQDSLTITSDARGVASAALRFGDRAGHATIRVSAPQIDLDDSLVYDFPHGTASAIDVEPVAPAYIGDTRFVVWHTYDANGHRVFGTPVLEVADTAVAAFVDQDNIRAKAAGVTWVRSRDGALMDSTVLAVVPTGTFGALSAGEWIVSPTNGVGPAAVFMPPFSLADPRYSASHDTLAYTEGGSIRLRLLGGSYALLTPGALGFAAVQNPEWSADGQWIYFTGSSASGSAEIWKVHPDGSGAVRAGPAASSTERDEMPAVNAAGTLLAFTTNRALAGGQPTLRIVTLPGGTTVYAGPAGTNARFAPDGARVAFLSGSQLMLVNADGTNLHRLTSLDLFVGQITWSPDSRWLLVLHGGSQSVPQYLQLIDATTGAAIQLPYTLGWTNPEWR